MGVIRYIVRRDNKTAFELDKGPWSDLVAELVKARGGGICAPLVSDPRAINVWLKALAATVGVDGWPWSEGAEAPYWEKVAAALAAFGAGAWFADLAIIDDTGDDLEALQALGYALVGSRDFAHFKGDLEHWNLQRLKGDGARADEDRIFGDRVFEPSKDGQR